MSADQVIARLRPKLAQVDRRADLPAGRAGHRRRAGGRSANSQYQYTLLGDDLDELRTWSQKLRSALQDVPEVDRRGHRPAAGRTRDRPDRRSRRGLASRPHREPRSTTRWAMPSRRRRCRPSTIRTVRSSTTSSWKWRRSSGRTRTASSSCTSAPRAARSAARRRRRRWPARRGQASGRHERAESALSRRTRRAISPPTRWRTPVAAIPRPVPRSAAAARPSCRSPPSATSLPARRRSRVNHTGTSVSTSIAFNLPEGESLSTALAAIDRTMKRDPRADQHPRRLLRHGATVPAERQQRAAAAARGASWPSTSCWACSTRATAIR